MCGLGTQGLSFFTCKMGCCEGKVHGTRLAHSRCPDRATSFLLTPFLFASLGATGKWLGWEKRAGGTASRGAGGINMHDRFPLEMRLELGLWKCSFLAPNCSQNEVALRGRGAWPHLCFPEHFACSPSVRVLPAAGQSPVGLTGLLPLPSMLWSPWGM